MTSNPVFCIIMQSGFECGGVFFFRGGQVSRLENQRGSILPDRYKVGNILQNESRIICYSSGNIDCMSTV